MDQDVVAGIITFIILVVLIGICIVLPITKCSMHNKDKEIELEKYKIEMQVNNGDVPTNEGE